MFQISCEADKFSRNTPSRTVSSVAAVAEVSFTEHILVIINWEKKGKILPLRWLDRYTQIGVLEKVVFEYL